MTIIIIDDNYLGAKIGENGGLRDGNCTFDSSPPSPLEGEYEWRTETAFPHTGTFIDGDRSRTKWVARKAGYNGIATNRVKGFLL